jgi:O-antigen/teichoic acid export membrane protein
MSAVQSCPPIPPATSISKRLFVSTGRVSIFQGVGLALGFGLQALISRSCGPSAVGVYTLFTTWLVILSVVTVPGLESCLVYFLPRLEGKAEAQRLVVRTCLLITGTSSLICSGALIAAGNRPTQWIGLPSTARIAFAVSLVFFSIGKLLDAVFLGEKDAPLTGYYNVVRLVLRILLCLPLLFHPAAAWQILFFAIAAESAVTVALRYINIQRRYGKLIAFSAPKTTSTPLTAARVVRTSLPLLGINVIDSVSPFLDKAILGMMVPLATIGVYRISECVSSLNSLFVAPFVAFWPYISSLSARRQLDELGVAYKNITLAIIALMLPFSLALFELSGFALSLFGPSFAAQGTPVFLVLAVGAIVDAIAGPAGAVLRLTDHYRLSLLINTVLIVIYSAAAVLLSRRFGIMGVAVARSATMIIGNVINVGANRLLLKVFPYTLKHLALLGCGVGILVFRLGLTSRDCGLGTHFAIASSEVIAFACCAFFILRSQIRQVPNFLRTFASAQG